MRIAFAIFRNAPDARITARFFEKQDQFGWHQDMLLDGATMQIASPEGPGHVP
ncbi:SidA/IucD/PvdA family monooxygenase [Rhodococcus sp. BE178]|uniref:SidA/IucD/PvdA family monooxygenase n=1 Tax=Rhodococcus sp. BE178 TaxID=2817737 RepID=UPI003D1DE382